MSHTTRTATPPHGKLGARLRALRSERGLSLRTLAARTGFSPSFISQVESDTTSLSIGSLEAVLAELGLTLGQFFTDLEAAPRMVIRRTERAHYESAWSRGVVEALTDGGPGRKLSAVAVTVAPGGASGTRAEQRHDTLVVMLAGALTLRMADAEVALNDGDTAYLPEGATVGWENRGQTLASALVIQSAPGLVPTGLFPAAAGNADRPPHVPPDREQ